MILHIITSIINSITHLMNQLTIISIITILCNTNKIKHIFTSRIYEFLEIMYIDKNKLAIVPLYGNP